MWQWCEDWYRASMNEKAVLEKFPSIKDDGGGQKYRVLRGASWSSLGRELLLSSFRFYVGPGYRSDYDGFRVVLASSRKLEDLVPMWHMLAFESLQAPKRDASGDAGACCAGRRGTTTIVRICCLRTVTTTIPVIETITTSFVSSWRRRARLDHLRELNGGGPFQSVPRGDSKLTDASLPRRKWTVRKTTPHATGEKTRRAGCRGQTAVPGLSFFQAPQPAPDHASGLVELGGHVEKLLTRDPSALVDDTPEDPEFFQSEIQPRERVGLFRLWRVDGLNAKFDGLDAEGSMR